MELDRFDRQLLNLVQYDAGQTAEQLANKVALSPSAIQRRLRRLRDQGVITREIALIDPKQVGPNTLFIVSLQVERESPELLGKLRAWLTGEPHVQQVFYVTGEADFVLIVTAPDTNMFDSLMSRMASENPNLKRFSTNVVLNAAKRGLVIPVELENDN